MTGHEEREPAAVGPDWGEAERMQPSLWRELGRLGRRARRRWLITLTLDLAITALVVAMIAQRPRSYASRVAFRVTEGNIDAETQPRTNGKLRDYVAQVVFSTKRLTAVIKEYGLYPSLASRDMSLAVESMRDDIQVEVWRNSFAQPRTPDDPTRSARLAITFHGRDAKVAYDVARDLGRLITEHEQGSRMLLAEAALRLADGEADAARELLTRRKRELVEKELARQHAPTPAEGVALLIAERNLEKGIPRAEKLAQQAEQKRQRAYLRLQLEKRALGLRWELIDPGRIEPEGISRRALLILVGSLMFMLALPLCVIVVGAFDARVYDLEDVRRLGLTTVGAVRRFGGDNVGALADRLRDDAGAPAHAPGHGRMGPS
jgi:hypothetical protein